MKRLLKRLLNPVLYLLAAVVIFVEDVLWTALSRLLGWVDRLPGLRWIEHRIAKLPPLGALVCFVIPALMSLPFKVLALYWLAGGHPVLGIGVILLAKMLSTALAARLFTLTRPTLLSIGWFARAYAGFMRLRAAAYSYVVDSAAGQAIRALRERVRAWFGRRRSWLKRRWQAIVARRRRAL